MSSATGPQPQGTCAYPLQGLGAWALEERENADCDKIKGTKISVEVLGDPGRGSTVKHSSAGSDCRMGQESHSSVKLHREARDLERPSSNPRETNLNQARPSTPQGLFSTTQSKPTDIKMPSDCDFRQAYLHRCLSAPAPCDPWHGVGEMPNGDTSDMVEGETKAYGKQLSKQPTHRPWK